jgi:hypothetical protein
MLQQVRAAYHRFVQRAGRSAWARPQVALNVVALEERATPTATPSFVPLVAPPQTVLVARIVATPIVGNGNGSGSLAIPSAGQSMVRLDLIAPGESGQADQPDENVFAKAHRQEPAAPLVAQTNADDLAVSDEELAELLAARPDA